MNRISRMTAAILLLSSLAGCYRQSIRAIGPDGEMLEDRGGVRESDTSFGLLYGLIPGKTEVDCPAGIARVDTGLPWFSFFLIYLTAGIVVPLNATYTCNTPAEQPATSDELPNGGW